jgi:hypothetical protein
MDYEFSYYKEEYLNRHYEIGNYYLSKWLGTQQSNVETLRKAYSKEGFDKETKFYALYNGKVIGFITSGLQQLDEGIQAAFMEFPLIDQSHLDVEEKLIDFAYETLRRKGVTKVISRASPRWGNTLKFVEKYGYEFKEILWKSARLNVSDFNLYVENSMSKDVKEEDYNDVSNILIDFRKMKEDEAHQQINLLKSIKERIISWRVVKQDGKIVGHDHLVQDKTNPEKARMNAIYSVSELIRDHIMSDHVKAAREMGIKYIDNFFWGPTLEMDKDYEKYGFLITDVSAYIRDI